MVSVVIATATRTVISLLLNGLLNTQPLNLINHTQAILNKLKKVLAVICVLQLRYTNQNARHCWQRELNELIAILVKSKSLQKKVDVIADIVSTHLICLVRNRVAVILVSNLKDAVL
jgi:hypothetical protein